MTCLIFCAENDMPVLENVELFVLSDTIQIRNGGMVMIIRIDPVSTIPIYVQLRNEIVKGIGRGELSGGECLPTVRQLAADLGVNSMTVSKAYQTLKAEGFIETDRRRGAVVRPDVRIGVQPDERFREKLEDELELLSAEAKIRGLGREEFIRLCSMAFAGMEE